MHVQQGLEHAFLVVIHEELARDLDAALIAGEIMIYFQPIIDAKTQDVRAMEALCRWRHPTRGFIPPNFFIPVAEEAGLIGSLGQYVMAAACRVAMTWPDNVHLSVNVSPIQLARADFLESVKHALDSSGLAPSRLEMEITESVLLDHDTRNLELLGQLHDLGIGISLDDFGTGYSSLSYLDRFAFDKIKIDRSFVMRLGDSSGISTIISAISLISKAYNAQTTAEGVETYEQAQLLRLAGIDNFQGYLFGAPHPAESWIFEDGKVSLRTDKVRSA
jgi:EAL domain-containing protein (putative c-di-GMP-specific phosphodiesterase class I)